MGRLEEKENFGPTFSPDKSSSYHRVEYTQAWQIKGLNSLSLSLSISNDIPNGWIRKRPHHHTHITRPKTKKREEEDQRKFGGVENWVGWFGWLYIHVIVVHTYVCMFCMYKYKYIRNETRGISYLLLVIIISPGPANFRDLKTLTFYVMGNSR